MASQSVDQHFALYKYLIKRSHIYGTFEALFEATIWGL